MFCLYDGFFVPMHVLFCLFVCLITSYHMHCTEIPVSVKRKSTYSEYFEKQMQKLGLGCKVT